MNKCKLITLNVNGMTDKTKRTKIFEYLKLLKAEIYVLQETHVRSKGQELQWTNEWGGKACWSRGTNYSCGMGLLINPNIECTINNTLTDHEGRILAVKCNINDTELNILSIYAPTNPQDRKVFFNTLWQYQPGNVNLLLAGDFNCIPDLDLDKFGGNPCSGNVGVAELNNFTSTNNLADVWRIKHPNDRVYTWHNQSFSMRSRLDRWYIPESFTNDTQAHIRACPFSDHSAAEITLNQIARRKRGPGFWKLNVSLLEDNLYKRETIAFLTFWKTQKTIFPELTDWWDQCKAELKKIAIRHSIRISKTRKQTELSLLKQLSQLKADNSPDVVAIQRIEEQLNTIVEMRTKGAQIRSRAKWIEEGEKPTKYFFQLEKKKQPKNTIRKLTTANGDLTSDIEILEETRLFYQNLYNRVETDRQEQDFFLHQITSTLSNSEKISCEGPVTEIELDRAQQKANSNKAPGPDGLPIEFYRTFWEYIKQDLLDMYNCNFDNGAMSDSQQTAILKLLFKKGDATLLTNWRPISLLNTDYKLLAAIMAARLKAVLSTVIHVDQTCGVPERTIYENIFRLRDMCYHAIITNSDLILINLDQEKAFDSVDRQFLIRVLQQMNFGPSFINWINVLYANTTCRVINNGWSSDTIFLRRGVRQGCPLSPLLYVVFVEVLAIAIRNNSLIQGIKIPGLRQESKITLYADDATLTLVNDFSVIKSFDVIDRFTKASGGKLNMTKTEGLYAGMQAGRTTGPVPIKWKLDSLDVLGMKIGNNMTQNWDKCVDKTINNFDRWSQRKLTLVGKLVLIKTFALANLVYIASAFLLPTTVVTRVHKAIFTFLWSGKNELVSRNTCHLPYSRGGLNIPDLRTMDIVVKTKWVNDITNKVKSRPWLSYARYWLGTALSTIKPDWAWLRSLRQPHADPTTLPPWYHVLKNAVQEHRAKIIQQTSDIHNSTLKTWLTMTDNTPPRAEAIWQRITQTNLAFNDIWTGIWKSYSDNGEKSLLWRATHHVLTTKSYLISWGLNINHKCPFCTHREDMFHALISCHRAKNLWSFVKPIMERICGQPVDITLQSVILMDGLTHQQPDRDLCRYLTALTITVLWTTRNIAINDRRGLNINVQRLLTHRVNQKINYDFQKHFTRVITLWAYKDILCTVQNDSLVLKL